MGKRGSTVGTRERKNDAGNDDTSNDDTSNDNHAEETRERETMCKEREVGEPTNQ